MSSYQDQLVKGSLINFAKLEVPFSDISCSVVIGAVKVGVMAVVCAVLDHFGEDGTGDIW